MGVYNPKCVAMCEEVYISTLTQGKIYTFKRGLPGKLALITELH